VVVIANQQDAELDVVAIEESIISRKKHIHTSPMHSHQLSKQLILKSLQRSFSERRTAEIPKADHPDFFPARCYWLQSYIFFRTDANFCKRFY
jgi:hypothetical protein